MKQKFLGTVKKIKQKINLRLVPPVIGPSTKNLYDILQKGLVKVPATVTYDKRLNFADVSIATTVTVKLLNGSMFQVEMLPAYILFMSKHYLINLETSVKNKDWIIIASAIEEQIGSRVHWAGVQVVSKDNKRVNTFFASDPDGSKAFVIREI